MSGNTATNENYVTSDHPPLQKTNSNKNLVRMPEVKFPTKKFRMRSLLWVKPTGVAVSSTSSLLAQLFPTIIVNLAALSSGMGYGFSAIALPQLKDYGPSFSDSERTYYQPFTIDENDGSWIAGIFGLGAVFGGFAAAILGSKYGRRKTILILTVPDILGWILIAASQNLPMILIGRFLQGFASAGYSPSIWIYVAEIAQPEYRGILSAITMPAIATGTLLSYCLGSIIDWNFVAVIAAAIPIILIPGLLLISNSPYWYLQQGEDKKALQAMEKFRASDANGLSELLAIADSLKFSALTSEITSMSDDEKPRTKSALVKKKIETIFGKRKYRRPFLILNALFLIMRFSGSYVISFYAVEIFRKADPHNTDSGSRDYLSAIGVGVIKLIGSLLFIPAIKYCTRKLLLCISSTIMSLSLAILGFAMASHQGSSFIPVELPAWVPLACVTLYMAVDPLGLSSVPFVYMAEFYSGEMRSLLSGITIGLSNLELFIVVKTFPMLSGKYGDGATFWLYSGFCLAAVIFTLLFIPETKGKSLEEIENYFNYKRNLHVTPFSTPGATPATRRREVEFTL
jgi:facilitated trehalose transporter